jgi:hypothetical protein
MKKLLYLFTASLVVLTSCSSNDDSYTAPSEDTSILPKTITSIFPSDFFETTSKSIATYNGNKISSIISEGVITIFTYEGNIITKKEQFAIDAQGKETKTTEYLYTYENGKLKSRSLKIGIASMDSNDRYIIKTIYTHNQDGTIDYIESSINSNTQVETKQRIGKLTYKDGNLIKSEVKESLFVFENGIRVFEYDAKNNPLKNVLGFSLLLDEISNYGNNNVVKITSTRPDYANPTVFLRTYIYNDNDYPLRYTSFSGDGKSIEYEIEYTY